MFYKNTACTILLLKNFAPIARVPASCFYLCFLVAQADLVSIARTFLCLSKRSPCLLAPRVPSPNAFSSVPLLRTASSAGKECTWSKRRPSIRPARSPSLELLGQRAFFLRRVASINNARLASAADEKRTGRSETRRWSDGRDKREEGRRAGP